MLHVLQYQIHQRGSGKIQQVRTHLISIYLLLSLGKLVSGLVLLVIVVKKKKQQLDKSNLREGFTLVTSSRLQPILEGT